METENSMKRFFERSLYLNLFRRGYVQLDTLGFTREMTRWYWSCGLESYRYHGADQRDFSVACHVPGIVFNFNLRVR